MTEVPKPKVFKDRAFLDTSHTSRCVVCNRYGCDPAHVRARGMGGKNGGDEWWNKMDYCRHHHQEQGQHGHIHMWNKYPKAKAAYEARGWYINEMGKFTRDIDDA